MKKIYLENDPALGWKAFEIVKLAVLLDKRDEAKKYFTEALSILELYWSL